MKKLLSLAICTFLFLCFSGVAQSTTITVENASFEEDSVKNGAWIYSIADWENPGTGSNGSGTWDPKVTTDYNYIQDGEQVAYTWDSALTQTLTTDLAANTLYSLSTFVGWRNHDTRPSPPEFLIELLGDGSTLASINTANLTKGNWTEVSLTYLSSNSVAAGQNLGIRLSGVVGSPTDFDMVSLSARTVPEPATMLLFGLGLLGVAGVSRRKNDVA